MVNTRSSRRVCHSLTSKPKPFTCTLLREVDLRDRRRYFRTRCGICWSSRGTKNTRLCSRCGHPFACYVRSWNKTLEYGFLGSGSQGPPQSLVGFFLPFSRAQVGNPKIYVILKPRIRNRPATKTRISLGYLGKFKRFSRARHAYRPRFLVGSGDLRRRVRRDT